MPKLFMASLGCAKNLVDAETMLGETLGDDFSLALQPEDADVVLINTCGFLEDARAEAREVIREFLEVKERLGGTLKVVATGCWAEREPDAVLGEFPDLDAAWGLRTPSDLREAIRGLFTDNAGCKSAGLGFRDAPREGSRLVTTLPSFAYLRLSDGCDNRCHYCAIPLIRGPLRSRSPRAVLEEAKVLEQQGVQELVLISQDTTAFGKDRPEEKTGLASLLRDILTETRVPRIRVLYAHPKHLDDETIHLLTSEPRLLQYLDLPIQHIADSVLDRMNRGYGRKRVEEIVAAFSRTPGFTLRTTLLLGYPGETEENFQEALDFVREGHFQHLGAFAYSPEPGTPAFVMDGRVDPDVARERRGAILEAQSSVAFAWLDSRVGGTEDALVDACPEPGWVIARTRREAPDADGILYLKDSRAKPGDMVRACISGREDYDLLGYTAQKKGAHGGKPKKRRR